MHHQNIFFADVCCINICVYIYIYNIYDTLITIIIRSFNIHGGILAAALDISKAFDGVWHTVLLQKWTTYNLSGKLFYLVLDGKTSIQFSINAGVPKS